MLPTSSTATAAACRHRFPPSLFDFQPTIFQPLLPLPLVAINFCLPYSSSAAGNSFAITSLRR
jgi:hypothetical protein